MTTNSRSRKRDSYQRVQMVFQHPYAALELVISLEYDSLVGLTEGVLVDVM